MAEIIDVALEEMQSPKLVVIEEKPPEAAVVAASASSESAVIKEADEVEPQRFQFTGSGSEYFRIWVVNLLLTILTFGVYSAWAKVRRLQYFYRNTRVADATFDYHGNPKAILKGRALAVGLIVAYKFAYEVSIVAAVVVALVLMAIMPWLLSRAFRFKMANSSYRGMRFRFQGTVAEAYRTLILFPVILGATGFFLWSVIVSFQNKPNIGLILMALILPLIVLIGIVPMAHFLLKRYQHDNAYFGHAPFFFYARSRDFFQIYGRAIGLLLLGSIPASIFGFFTGRLFRFLEGTTFGWLFTLAYSVLSAYAFYLFVRPYLESRIQNLVWNNTELGDHRFESTASARKLIQIHATNLALITVTCGLYKPFAAVRLIKYRVENMTLIPSDNLEDFLADQSADHAGAVGQEAGDIFDIDIAL